MALMTCCIRSALLCEWECYPEAVVYHHPYIIAFDQRFVEVRHVETVMTYDMVRKESYVLKASSFIGRSCSDDTWKRLSSHIL